MRGERERRQLEEIQTDIEDRNIQRKRTSERERGRQKDKLIDVEHNHNINNERLISLFDIAMNLEKKMFTDTVNDIKVIFTVYVW